METSSHELDPVVIGYIASLWLAGRYSSLAEVDLNQPGSSAQHQTLTFWRTIQQQVPAALIQHFITRQRSGSRGAVEVQSLIDQLRGYTSPLQADVRYRDLTLAQKLTLLSPVTGQWRLCRRLPKM